ncbi:MAG TPA: adenylate/guanylate cyclase domain-containing protein [Candidatus Limnocylindria bacterium]|nr:adenylate/guanylate cyclase domain-containing protein [Candidatus Limnocylindria bacterium]
MSWRGLAARLLGIADLPTDDDDARLRKRVGVVVSYLTIFAPLGVPFFSGGNPIGFVMGFGLSALSIVNVVVLARTKEFERYAVVLLVSGVLFTLGADVLIGGLATGAGLIWAFLAPLYALLALGPGPATAWFVVYLAALLVAVLIDPWVTANVSSPPYTVRLLSFAQNLAVPLGITFILLRYTDIRRRAAEARSDELLTNAIPRSIATRLRHGEQRIAETYPNTTVVFADLVGFTPWARQTSPADVVAFLDDLFRRFDTVAATHGVEKIKTIGDAYMAVAGAPDTRPDHAKAAIGLAIGMQDALVHAQPAIDGPMELRIGVASGPVVGGVIGQARILFDLWGDTVNTASRMESSGVPGRIQVDAVTHALLQDDFAFEARDAVEVKGLGRMTTYLLVRD